MSMIIITFYSYIYDKLTVEKRKFVDYDVYSCK